MPILFLGLAGCATTPLPEPTGPGGDHGRKPAWSGDLSAPIAGPASALPPTARSGPTGEREVRAMVARLIPPAVKDRQVWAGDLQVAFSSLGIPHAPQIYCAAIAVIEQESSFQADPVVPGLPAIVWRELEQRGQRYGLPKLLLTTALRKKSPDGRSYAQRIDALQTEKQLDALFADMIAELPAGKRLLADTNPVRTGGPMQVSIAFAEQWVRDKPYPYPLTGSVRREVFSRRGGVYFGSAILLDYPAPYDDVLYRFADFNAGRYSSRNAAFQVALGRLSGKALVVDGDLLRYRDAQPLAEPSAVEIALRSLAGPLRMSPAEIRRDLLLEKTASFGQSPLFSRAFALAEKATGQLLPRQAMPRIDLKSPKITRQLTTEWFAHRVDGRYRHCLTRAEGST